MDWMSSPRIRYKERRAPVENRTRKSTAARQAGDGAEPRRDIQHSPMNELSSGADADVQDALWLAVLPPLQKSVQAVKKSFEQ